MKNTSPTITLTGGKESEIPYPVLDNTTKSFLLKKLVVAEAEKGFAPYLYELIPDVEKFYHDQYDKTELSMQCFTGVYSREMLIKWIVSLCDPVFVFEIENNQEQQLLDLLIIIRAQDSRGFKDIDFFLQKVAISNWNIHYTFCIETQFNELRKQGSIFYIIKCNKKNLLYSKSELPLTGIEGDMFQNLLSKARVNFLKSSKKSRALFDQSISLYKSGLWALSCFMLHQAAEIVLWASVATLTGVNMRQHSIKNLLNYCSRFHKAYATMFQTHAEFEMLAILERSYTEARYQNEFTVDDYVIRFLTEKVQSIITLTCELMEQYISSYEING